MKKFLTPLFLTALVTLLFAGCNSANTTMVGLNVELAGVNHAGDGTTTVTWRVLNPNVISYLVAEASHRVYLDGVLVGSIDDKEPLAVLAQNQTDRTSRLVTAGPAAERVIAAAATAGTASYRLESTVTIRLYGETTDRSKRTAAGTVRVTGK